MVIANFYQTILKSMIEKLGNNKKCHTCITYAALLIRCQRHRQIFANLDRFLGRHAVLSDSVGRHKHFFSL